MSKKNTLLVIGRWLSLLLCVVVLVLSVLSVQDIQWPYRNLPLSVDKSLATLGDIAQKPHPRGSAEHARVYQYLLNKLTALGAKPIQMLYDLTYADSTVTGWNPNIVPTTRVSNLMVVFPGQKSTDAVLVDGHYDSVPMGPGASDDAIAVANMVQMVEKILADNLTFDNTVIFLFTDGEEEGLYGADLFAQGRTPVSVVADGVAQSAEDAARYAAMIDQVRFVINLEQRGTGGVTIMFETAPKNAATIQAFAKVNPGLFTSSLAAFVYAQMPNGTDFSPYVNRGIQGLNFANIGEGYNYHTQGDSLANVSRAVVAQDGAALSQTLAHFANAPLAPLYEAKGDAVFFSLLGMATVAFPAWVAWAIAGATVLLLALFCWRGSLTRKHFLRRTGLSLVTLILGIGLGALAAMGVSSLVGQMGGALALRFTASTYASATVVLGLGALAACVALLVWGLMAKLLMLTGRDLRDAAGLLAGLFSLVTVVVLPAASYLFLFSALLASLLMAIETFRVSENPTPLGLHALSFMASALVTVPMVLLAGDALGADMAPLLTVLLTLMGALVLPYALDMPQKRQVLAWLSACGLLLVLGAGALGIEALFPTANHMSANLTGKASGRYIRFSDDMVIYRWDADGIQTPHLTLEDPQMAHFYGKAFADLGFTPGEQKDILIAPAQPLANLQLPVIGVAYDAAAGTTTLDIQKAYPDSDFTLIFPTGSVTAVAYSDDLGAATYGFNPQAENAPSYNTFTSRQNTRLVITSAAPLEGMIYQEYLVDTDLTAQEPLVAKVLALDPGIRPELVIEKAVPAQ